MLTDSQVLPTCYFWAKKLLPKRNSYIQFNDLVNEAYVEAKKLDNPLLLQKWVKWTMIHYIQSQTSLERVQPLDEWMEPVDKSFGFSSFYELQSDLMLVVDEVCDSDDKELLYMSFWEKMNYREIASLLGITHQGVGYRMDKILRKLRKAYEKRAK